MPQTSPRWLSDLRVAWRSLRRSPGYTLGILGTLTLGTAPALALFNVVHSILFVPLPARAPERMVLLTEALASTAVKSAPTSPANFLDWQAQSRSFSAMVAVSFDSFTWTGGTDPVSFDGARVSADYFPVTRLAMVAGRGFLPEEDVAGAQPVVVLSETTWRKHFGADRQLVGKTIPIDGRDHHVVGVARSSFMARHELWVPLALDPAAASRSRRGLGVMAELRPGVTLAAARQEMEALSAHLAEAYPQENGDARVVVEPLADRLYVNQRPALLSLVGAGAFLLLLACANVASLMLARGLERDREMAIRAALGVGRLALARSLLLECGLLVTASVALGLGFALAVARLLAASRLENIPRLSAMGIHGGDFLAAVAVILLATVACALLPIRLAWRARLTGALRGHAGRVGLALRNGLVVVQVALALMLVTGASLTLAGFQRLSRVELGFEPAKVLSFQLRPPAARYPNAAARGELFRELLERLRQAPGVTAASLTAPMPLAVRAVRRSAYAEAAASTEAYGTGYRAVAPGYFATLGIPLLAGRDLSAADTQSGERALVINQAFAQAAWPGRDPIGKRLAFEQREITPQTAWTVIGVAGDARQVQLEREAAPEVFVSFLQAPPFEVGLLLAGTGEPLALAAAAREAVRELDPQLALRQLRPLDDVVAEALAQPRYASLVIGLVAALALALAAAGIFGVLRHTVERRSRELGIRMALGAGRRQILALVARQGAWTVSLGALAGVAGALALERLLTRVVYGIRGVEPGALLTALGLLALAAGLAIASPARRAAAADPVAALRREE